MLGGLVYKSKICQAGEGAYMVHSYRYYRHVSTCLILSACTSARAKESEIQF